MPLTPQEWSGIQQINTNNGSSEISNDELLPRVIQLENNNVLHAYISNDSASENPTFNIVGKLFDPVGNQIGAEFVINSFVTTGNIGSFNLAATKLGGFAVVYSNVEIAETKSYLQTFDDQMNEVVSTDVAQLLAPNEIGPIARTPDLAVNSQGDIAVIYNLENDANDTGLLVRIFDVGKATFSPVETVSISDVPRPHDSISTSHVIALNNGNFAVIFNDHASDEDTIYYQVVNPDGTLLGGDIKVNTNSLNVNQDPHAVALTSGFVIVWEIDSSIDSGNSGVRVRLVNDDGSFKSNEIVVSTTVNGNQSDPVVASLTDGGFVVAWFDENTSDIHGQRFDDASQKVGSEFNIEQSLSPSDSKNISIKGLADGRFVVSWDEISPAVDADTGQPIVETNVFSRTFDPRDETNPVVLSDPNLVLVGTGADDEISVPSNARGVYGHGGNDRFVFTNADVSTPKTIDGGDGIDTIVHSFHGTIDLADDRLTVTNIENIEFSDSSISYTHRRLEIDASQVGSTISASGEIKFGNKRDTLDFDLGDIAAFDASTFSILNFDGEGLAGDSIWFRTDNATSGIQLTTTEFDDIIQTGTQSDVIIAGDGNNEVTSRGGDDTIITGDGNDFVNAGDGNDRVFLGGGDDTIYIKDDETRIDDQSQFDIVFGSTGFDHARFLEYNSVKIEKNDGLLFNFQSGNVFDYNMSFVDKAGNVTTYTAPYKIAEISDFEHISGTLGNDVFISANGIEMLDGNGGNDQFIHNNVLSETITYSGGRSSDTVDFAGFEYGIWVDLAFDGIEAWHRGGETVQTGTYVEIADLLNVENVVSTSFSDHIFGDDEDNTITYAGNTFGIFDRFDGREGIDTADFSNSGSAVWVDLEYDGVEAWTRYGTDVESGTWSSIAKLESFENLGSSAFADRLMGDDQANTFFFIDNESGIVLPDRFDGRGGEDTADFSASSQAVWVNLAHNGVEAWTRGGTDINSGEWKAAARVDNIENITASNFADELFGNDQDNVLTYYSSSNDGDYVDLYEGNLGSDTASFSGASEGVWVDLAYNGVEAWSRGVEDLDETPIWRTIADLSGIENVTGSDFDDELFGDDSANILSGGLQTNELTGRGGADIFDIDENSRKDTITDFEQGLDLIQLNDPTGIYDVSYLTITNDADDTIIYYRSNVIVLEGIDPNVITIDDFTNDFIMS